MYRLAFAGDVARGGMGGGVVLDCNGLLSRVLRYFLPLYLHTLAVALAGVGDLLG
jgi:hypothetical protein